MADRQEPPGSDFSWPFERALEIRDAYDAARRDPLIQRRVYTLVHSTQLGFLWEEHIAPTTREDLNRRISEAHAANVNRIMHDALHLPANDAVLIDVLIADDLEGIRKGEPIADHLYEQVRAARGLRGFSAVARQVVATILKRLKHPLNPDPERLIHAEALEEFWEHWRRRLQPVTPRLVASVHDVYREYMLWLKRHPSAIHHVAWDAFEKIIGEIFASRGFEVVYTARLRNQSADVLAVRADTFGVETRYLVEAKRYGRENHVGMDIVNAVLGAARRADVEHAFLVTTSSFTQDVQEQKARLADLRLHLRDGDDVRSWLRDYAPKSDGGIWLPPSALGVR